MFCVKSTDNPSHVSAYTCDICVHMYMAIILKMTQGMMIIMGGHNMVWVRPVATSKAFGLPIPTSKKNLY